MQAALFESDLSSELGSDRWVFARGLRSGSVRLRDFSGRSMPLLALDFAVIRLLNSLYPPLRVKE